MSSLTEQFAQRNAEVFGVSMDSTHTNRAYAESMGGLGYPLLSDWKPHGALTRALGIEVAEAGCPSRTTVIDRYAHLAAQCGVAPTETIYERYLAHQLLRAGAGRRAASIFASLAIGDGRWGDFPRVAAASRITVAREGGIHGWFVFPPIGGMSGFPESADRPSRARRYASSRTAGSGAIPTAS